MRELELLVRREMEEQQLQHEQEILYAQLAAGRSESGVLKFCREVWPLFISSFVHTTAACGFTNLENLKWLQDCLLL